MGTFGINKYIKRTKQYETRKFVMQLKTFIS